MSEYLWQCPFCAADQAVTEKERQVTFSDLTIKNAEGPRRLVVKYVVCPNPRCREFSLSASLHALETSGRRAYTGKQLAAWSLVPPSNARSFPVALPAHILEDYREACLIAAQSPKAASALARSCLSSMLRDYWRIQPGSLSDEFRQIKGSADPLTWEAIDSVRGMGTIGARMESEGAEILETEPGEAKLLIGLIETLLQDWYVGRETRRRNLEEIRQIAESGSPERPAGV